MLIPETLSVHDEREREKVQAEVSMLLDLENCIPQICALRRMFLPAVACCKIELEELLTDVRSLAARQNDLPDGENLASIKDKIGRLQTRLDELTMPMLERLAARCEVIVRSLRDWLQGNGIVNKSELNDPKLLAHLMAHLLLTGRCCCGEDQERLQKLHKKSSNCRSEHRLSGWDWQRETLNHFLLRALLGHRFGSDWNLTDESQLQNAAGYALKTWSPRQLANGMLLYWVQPTLEAVLIPVCRGCSNEVSLRNTCACKHAAPPREPHVVDLTWRLVRQEQRLRYQSLSMYRIRREADGFCVHGGDNGNAKLVFPAVPLPFVKAKDRPANSSGPTCPYCHLALGDATAVDVRISEAESTDVGTIEDGAGQSSNEAADKPLADLAVLETAATALLERDGDADRTIAAFREFQEQAGRLYAQYSQLSPEEFQKQAPKLKKEVSRLVAELRKKSRKAAEVLGSRMRPRCEEADEV